MAINLANPVNWQHPLNRGLLFWGLSLAQDCKPSIMDMCGRVRFPAPAGGAAWGGAKHFELANPLQCTSSGAKIEIATPAHLQLGVPITVSCWFRSNGSVGSDYSSMFGVLHNNTGAAPYTSYCLSKGLGGDLFYGYTNTAGSFYGKASTYQTVDPTWNMWSMTLSGTALRLFFNDRWIATEAGISSPTYDASTILAFGDFTGSGGRNLNGFLNDGRIYNRELDPSEIVALYVEGRTGHRHTLNRVRPSMRAVMEVAGGGTSTAAVALTVGAATAAATATFTKPTYTGTAALSVGAATAAASATFTKPTYTATVAASVVAATCAVSATFTKPTYTATVTATAGAAVTAVSATFTKPTYTGAVAVTAGAATLAASATFTKPTYTGTCAVTVGAATCQAYTIPTFAATVGLTAGVVTVAVSATFTKPTYTATIAATIAAATTAATATFTKPTYTATCAVTAGAATCQAYEDAGTAFPVLIQCPSNLFLTSFRPGISTA